MSKESKKTNPLLAGIVNMLPAIVNTVGTIFKNKKNKDKGTTSLLPALLPDAHNIAAGLELSSKAVVGYGLGGVIVMYALGKDLSQKHNLVILSLGVFLVAVTSVVKVLGKGNE